MFFSEAFADATAPAQAAGSPWSTIIMLVVFFGIFYFLLIRPQTKRAKAHRAMVEGLAQEDEVLTTGGIMGKIQSVDETSAMLLIAKDVTIKIQKAAVSSVLPKGTLNF